MSSIKIGGIALTNISDIVERFGANVIEQYEEQFLPSPLLYQILVAIEVVAIVCIGALHVVLVYKEQLLLQETFEEIEKKQQ